MSQDSSSITAGSHQDIRHRLLKGREGIVTIGPLYVLTVQTSVLNTCPNFELLSDYSVGPARAEGRGGVDQVWVLEELSSDPRECVGQL